MAFERLIDIGCGSPDEHVYRFPAFNRYVGVDRDDHTGSKIFSLAQAEFIQMDGLVAIAALNPRLGDLVVSLFSAHHVGVEPLLNALNGKAEDGLEYLIVDAVLTNTKSFWAHYFTSIVFALMALFRARLLRQRNLAWLSAKHLRFLASASGLAHARSDFRLGLQHIFHPVGGRYSAKRFGALWAAYEGKIITQWLSS